MNVKPANATTGNNNSGTTQNTQVTSSSTKIEQLPVNQLNQNTNQQLSKQNQNLNQTNIEPTPNHQQIQVNTTSNPIPTMPQTQQQIRTATNQSNKKVEIKPNIFYDLKPQAFIPLIATVSSMTSIIQSLLAILFKYKQINNNLIEQQITTKGIITLISHSIYILVVTIITIIFAAKIDIKEKHQYQTITIIISLFTIIITIYFNQIIVNSFIEDIARKFFPYISDYIQSLLI